MFPLDTPTANEPLCLHPKREYIAADGDMLLVAEICDECGTIRQLDEVRFIHREKES